VLQADRLLQIEVVEGLPKILQEWAWQVKARTCRNRALHLSVGTSAIWLVHQKEATCLKAKAEYLQAQT
jgi:hypothetical protein